MRELMLPFPRLMPEFDANSEAIWQLFIAIHAKLAGQTMDVQVFAAVINRSKKPQAILTTKLRKSVRA